MKFDFIKSLNQKEIVKESVDIETTLFQRLEQETRRLSESENPRDVIHLDVPLFLRLLEYAREDAKTDMDLHYVTEKVTAISSSGQPATMDDYENIIGKSSEPAKETESLSMLKLLAGLSNK